MTLKKTELAVIGLTVAFFCFVVGYFSGQSSAKGTFSVKTELDSAALQVTAAASPSQSPAVQTGSTQSVSTAPSGTQTVVPSPDSAAPQKEPPAVSIAESGAQSESGQGKLIDINSAGTALLDTLPGIGPVLAGRIVEYRQKYGAYKKTEDIMLVKGIGEGIYSDIKDFIEAR